jgi:hypothetical protein
LRSLSRYSVCSSSSCLIAFVSALHFLIIFLILCAAARRWRFSGSVAPSSECPDITRPMTQPPQPKNSHWLPIECGNGSPLCGLQQLIGDIEQRFMPADCRYARAARHPAAGHMRSFREAGPSLEAVHECLPGTSRFSRAACVGDGLSLTNGFDPSGFNEL